MKNLSTTTVLWLLCLALHAQPWQKMADLPTDLAFPVVVQLRGNIHVMGGGATGGATDLHLRYRPAVNKWDTMPPVPYKAQQPAGAVVNGKIHFCGGGFPNSGSLLDDHYYYDPDSNKWFAATKLPFAIAIHKAEAVNGLLFVMTGQPDKVQVHSYNPGTGQWTSRNSLPDQDFWYGAITSNGKTIYRFGGGGYTNPTNAAHYYNAANDIWEPLPDLPIPLHAAAASMINDSLVCISGGYYKSKPQNKCWLFDVKTKQYFVSDTLPRARDYHGMATAGGCVYSVGGDNPSFAVVGVSLIKNCSPAKGALAEVAEAIYPASYQLLQYPGCFRLESLQPGLRFSVIDLTGRLLVTERTLAGVLNSAELNLPDGLYLIRLRDSKSDYCTKAIVQQ